MQNKSFWTSGLLVSALHDNEKTKHKMHAVKGIGIIFEFFGRISLTALNTCICYAILEKYYGSQIISATGPIIVIGAYSYAVCS